MSKASRFQGAFQVLNCAFPKCAGISASRHLFPKFQYWAQTFTFSDKVSFSQSNMISDSCHNAAANTWSHDDRLKIVIVGGIAGP
jgi:hypothetical protein